MKVYHAFTLDRMYQIKKHGILASALDGLVYVCDNDEDALEWILEREHARGKKVSRLGLAIFDADVDESFDHTTELGRAFVVKGNIHPSRLSLFQIVVLEDYFYHTPEINTLTYEKPSDKLRFQIFCDSVNNQMWKNKWTGKIEVGLNKYSKEQLKEAYIFSKKELAV